MKLAKLLKRAGKLLGGDAKPRIPAVVPVWSGAEDRDPALRRFVEEVRGGLLARESSSLAEVDRQIQRTRDELKGKSRVTSYAHEMREMDCASVLQGVSAPPLAQSLLYYGAVRWKPSYCVEIGSAFGVGSMAIVAALRDNGAGVLDGVEYEEWRCGIADANCRAIKPGVCTIHHGAVEEVLPKIVGGRKVGFAFVDAVHRYAETMGYHDLLAPYMQEGGLIIYDDVNYSDDMKRFWADVVHRPNVIGAVLFNERWGLLTCHAGASV